MNILVFGAGAMGSVFGGFLSQENEVVLIGRKSHMAAVNSQGLRVSGIWGEHIFRKIRGFTSVSDLKDKTLFDLIMITTKSYATEDAAGTILPYVKKGTAVMSMQNGIGNEDIISQIVGSENTMGGMAIFGARIVEPGHAEVTVYASECKVGDLENGKTKRAESIAKTFSSAGIPTVASENIIRDKWMKAFYNIALNPLSAILHVPYGDLGEMEDTREIMKSLLNEAFEVALALKVPLKVSENEYFEYLIDKQLPPTSKHISSMLQDIEKGKKTEIDYLNGAVSILGQKIGVKTPVNDTITLIIKALEKSG